MSRRSSFLLKEKAFAFLVQQPAPKLIQYHIRDWIQVKKKDKKDSFCWILLGFPLHTRPAGSSELDYRPIRLKQLWGSISLDCYSQNTIRLIAALFYYREEREHKDLLFILITVKTAMPDFFLFIWTRECWISREKAALHCSLPPNTYGHITYHHSGPQVLAKRGEWARLPVSSFSYLPHINQEAWGTVTMSDNAKASKDTRWSDGSNRRQST